jgi:hypothetical protein
MEEGGLLGIAYCVFRVSWFVMREPRMLSGETSSVKHEFGAFGQVVFQI